MWTWVSIFVNPQHVVKQDGKAANDKMVDKPIKELKEVE